MSDRERSTGMINPCEDEGLRCIVSAGIIPAIKQKANNEEETVDTRVAAIGMLVDAYNKFFHTGRG